MLWGCWLLCCPEPVSKESQSKDASLSENETMLPWLLMINENCQLRSTQPLKKFLLFSAIEACLINLLFNSNGIGHEKLCLKILKRNTFPHYLQRILFLKIITNFLLSLVLNTSLMFCDASNTCLWVLCFLISVVTSNWIARLPQQGKFSKF